MRSVRRHLIIMVIWQDIGCYVVDIVQSIGVIFVGKSIVTRRLYVTQKEESPR